jgi:hypothetical protein
VTTCDSTLFVNGPRNRWASRHQQIVSATPINTRMAGPRLPAVLQPSSRPDDVHNQQIRLLVGAVSGVAAKVPTECMWTLAGHRTIMAGKAAVRGTQDADAHTDLSIATTTESRRHYDHNNRLFKNFASDLLNQALKMKTRP